MLLRLVKKEKEEGMLARTVSVTNRKGRGPKVSGHVEREAEKHGKAR